MRNGRRPKSSLSEMLQAPLKDISSQTNILSRLARVIFSDLNVRPQQFHIMMNQYLNDPINGFATPEKRSSEKGNLQKELMKPNITWKTIIKLSRVLNPRRIKLSISYEWWDGSITTHSVESSVMASHNADIRNVITTVGNKRTPPKDALEKALDMLDSDAEYHPQLECDTELDEYDED